MTEQKMTSTVNLNGTYDQISFWSRKGDDRPMELS